MLDPPDRAVLRLLDRRAAESVWTTTVTLFELQVGIERLPRSRKKSQLEASFQRALDLVLENRLLSFDDEAAMAAAKLSADREQRGRPIDTRDTMIAGIVISRRAEFATRNTRHFADLDLPVIDPWTT